MRAVQTVGEWEAVKRAFDQRIAMLDYQVMAEREQIEALETVRTRILLDNIPF